MPAKATKKAAHRPQPLTPVAVEAPPEPPKLTGLAALGKIRKTIAVLIGANATWATAALLPTAHVTIAEWIALGIANATALGVYSVANEPLQADSEAGHAVHGVLGVVVIVLAVIFVLWLLGAWR